MRSQPFIPLALALGLLAASGPVQAEEPAGCEKFKWPIQREQSALANPDRKTIGADAVFAAGRAVMVLLAPLETVHFTLAPDRAPAPKTFGAVLKLSTPPAGVYTVSLSAGAWLDVIQDGAPLKPLAFSGAQECPHIRKSLKFQLASRETVIQISNSTESEISLVVLPQ